MALSTTLSKPVAMVAGTDALASDVNTDIDYCVTNINTTNTEVNLKSPSASPTFTGTVVLPSTTSIGLVSAAELLTLDGVTSAIQAQIDLKAPLASPSLTGVPTAPTAATNTATTQLATTAFVVATAFASTSTLPGQTSSTGKFLSTNGTDISWQDTQKPATEIQPISGRILLGGGFGTQSTFVTGKIYYTPIFVQKAITVTEVATKVNGATATDIVIGIYSSVDGAPATLLRQTAAIVNPGTAVVSAALASPLALTQGTLYFMAVSASSTTGTGLIQGSTYGEVYMYGSALFGYSSSFAYIASYDQTIAYSATLPATATPSSLAGAAFTAGLVIP